MFRNILSPENKALLLANAKQFAINLGLIVAASGVDFALANIGLLAIPGWAAIPLGLLLSEVHNYLDQKYQLDSRVSSKVARFFGSSKN